jgi:hypothetical protein
MGGLNFILTQAFFANKLLSATGQLKLRGVLNLDAPLFTPPLLFPICILFYLTSLLVWSGGWSGRSVVFPHFLRPVQFFAYNSGPPSLMACEVFCQGNVNLQGIMLGV